MGYKTDFVGALSLEKQLFLNIIATFSISSKQRYETKRPGLQKKNFFFIAKICELMYEFLYHPPYSPDLAVAFLSSQKCSSNTEVIAATEGYFADLPESIAMGSVS